MKFATTFRRRSIIRLVRNLLIAVLLLANTFQAVVAAVFCADPFHMMEQIGKEDYDGACTLDLGAEPRTPLHRGTFTNLLCELDGEPFRRAVAFTTNGQAQPVLPEYKVFWGTNHDRILMQVAYKKAGFSSQAINRFCDRFRRYASDREQGHSRAYALASLQEYQSTDSLQIPSSAAEEFCRTYKIPPKWLRRDTNGEPYVIDGLIAWVYPLPLTQRPLVTSPPTRVDAQEFDPRVRPVLDAVRRQVLETSGAGRSGEAYYSEVQLVLRTKYGISWTSPLELNTGLIVDFAPQRGRLTNGLSQ